MRYTFARTSEELYTWVSQYKNDIGSVSHVPRYVRLRAMYSILVFSVRLNIASEYTATREHKESESFIFCGFSPSLAVSKILRLFGLISLSWVMLDISVPFRSQNFFLKISTISQNVAVVTVGVQKFQGVR